MQELALFYLRKALEEALNAGATTLLDDLFSKLTEKQVDALIALLEVVKRRKTQKQAKTG